MALVEGKDFILIKHANYAVGMVRHSGNLVVIPGRIILNVLQIIDPFDGGGGGETLKESWNELKESTRDLKKSFKEMFDYGKGVEAIRGFAAEASDVQEFANRVSAVGTRHETSLDIDTASLRSLEIGFFKGVRMTFADGRVIHIRSGKLGAIRKLLGL